MPRGAEVEGEVLPLGPSMHPDFPWQFVQVILIDDERENLQSPLGKQALRYCALAVVAGLVS